MLNRFIQILLSLWLLLIFILIIEYLGASFFKKHKKKGIMLWDYIKSEVNKKFFLAWSYIKPKINEEYFILWDTVKLNIKRVWFLIKKIITSKLIKFIKYIIDVWSFNNIDNFNTQLRYFLKNVIPYTVFFIIVIVINVYVFIFMIQYWYIIILVIYIFVELEQYKTKQISFLMFRTRITIALVLITWALIFIF